MPKEISHIALAQKVSEQLPQDSLFNDPIKTHHHLYLYGAVAPDIPYFYILGRNKKKIQALTQGFHTTDSNSLLPILKFLKHFPQKDPDALAFAAGICCHILSDTHFHPMVYYFAGMDDVHEGATARHRLFETAMDFYFWHLLTDKRTLSLKFLKNRLEITGHRFRYFVHTLFALESGSDARCLDKSVTYHQIIQALFFSGPFYKTIRYLYDHKVIKKSRYHALCYPYKEAIHLKFFNSPITYRDPCNGGHHTITMETLTQKTMTRTITLLNIIEKTIIKTEDITCVMDHPDLPEIRPCLVNDKKTFKHWYGKKKIENMLYGESTP